MKVPPNVPIAPQKREHEKEKVAPQNSAPNNQQQINVPKKPPNEQPNERPQRRNDLASQKEAEQHGRGISEDRPHRVNKR